MDSPEFISESSTDKLDIRPLKSNDFDGVVELDSKLLGGENRHDYWEKKFAIFRMRHPNLSLVALVDNQVIGCVMGNISGWEFGVSAGIGWLELIGVDQEYRRRGIARALIDELLKQFNKLHVKKVYTMFDTIDAGNRDFFHSAGFKVGNMVQLEIDLD